MYLQEQTLTSSTTQYLHPHAIIISKISNTSTTPSLILGTADAKSPFVSSS